MPSLWESVLSFEIEDQGRWMSGSFITRHVVWICAHWAQLSLLDAVCVTRQAFNDGLFLECFYLSL